MAQLLPLLCRWAKELDILADEQPNIDRSLIQSILEDQDGDVKEVRVMLKVSVGFSVTQSMWASQLS